jgi:hypothetical protein
MSFTLRLGFGGLCLFVPEVVDGTLKRMHVLLPATTVGSEHEHEPLLICDALPRSDSDLAERARRRDIRNRVVDLSAVRSGTELDEVPKGVASLSGLGSIPREMVKDGYKGDEISARVTFAAGDSRLHHCGRGGRWWFRGKEQHLAIRVVWKIRVKGSELVVPVWDIDNPGQREEYRLSPCDDRLDLWIFHAPKNEAPRTLPPLTNRQPPKPRDKARHFGPFEELLRLPADRYTPVFREPEYPENGPFPDCYYPFGEQAPGLDLFCIAATAPLKP